MAHRSRSAIVSKFVALAAGLLLSAASFAADRAVFQITENDPDKWNLVLNNVRNLQSGVAPGSVDVEVVAYGPGIQLLKTGSPIAARISEAVGTKVRVVACENTMENAKLTKADMLTDIGYVPSGVVEVMRKLAAGLVVHPSVTRAPRRRAASVHGVSS